MDLWYSQLARFQYAKLLDTSQCRMSALEIWCRVGYGGDKYSNCVLTHHSVLLFGVCPYLGGITLVQGFVCCSH